VAEVPTNSDLDKPSPPRVPVTWRTHWQAPVLLLALALLAAGIMTLVLTTKKPDVARMLDEADQLVHAEKYQPALEVLNKKLRGYVNAGSLNHEQRRHFHTLRARAMYLLQQTAGIDLEENARSIADEYGLAIEAGGDLEPQDRYFLGHAQITLGKYRQAIDLAQSLPPEARANKGKLVKRVVEGLLAAPEFDSETTLRLLADFLGERELTVADRGWALARQAELLMRQGLLTSAITKLLQTMPSLVNDLDRDQLGELYLFLGKAYYATDALSEATRQLNLAAQLLLPEDHRHAQATVLLAKIDEQIGEPPEEGRAQAKLKYTDVIERFPSSPTRLPALLGLAEVNSLLGDIPGSLAAYTELVDAIIPSDKPNPTEPSIEAVTQSLMSQASRCFDLGHVDKALDFTVLAERMHKVDAVPPEVLAMIAKAHRKTAEGLFSAEHRGQDRLMELARLDPATREQVRQHLIAAARYYKRHADRIGINDNTGFGRSLWMAADSYDQAGDIDLAVPLFADYAKFFPGEPQQPEARYRLAKAFQAKGDYSTAEDGYRQLIEEGSNSSSASGPWGDASHVPLAQCYLVDGDPANDGLAEELLTRVVQGHAGGTASPQFKSALVELGRLKAGKGDFAGAIQLLNEAATRFPETIQLDGVRYELAEAFRQDAREILKTLGEAMPDARRQSLVSARTERLQRAAELYDETRKSLETRDPARLTKLESLHLRNSSFYVADCRFELRDYENAIRLYDAAREKYSSDPASLVAMVQIVNAYVEQGDMKRAATAQERARRFYDSLPVSAWSDPNLPMSRDDWARWLKSMNALQPIKGSESATAATPPSGSDGH
jgi:tetratricopeptide (TPR) repeat protein